MESKKLKLFLVLFILSLSLSLLYLSGAFSNIQLVLSDNLYGGIDAREDIVILAIDDKSLQEIGRWPWDRKVFADLIHELDDAKAIGVDVAFFERSDEEDDLALIQAVRENGKVIVPVEYTSYERTGEGVRGEDVLEPIDGLEEAALDTGYINIITDPDGVARAVNLDVKGKYDSFASSVYQAYTGKEYEDEKPRYLVNFAGPAKSFETYPISDAIKGIVDTEKKIVLIGATAPDLHDDAFVPTSRGKAMPGVEIHANTLQTMLDDNELRQESRTWVVLSIILLCLIAGILSYCLNPWIALAANLSIITGYVFLSISMFSKGIILNIVYVPAAIFLGEAAAIAYSYITEKKEKKQLYDAFNKYVSADVIKDIMEDPEKLKLGGEKKEITLLFSDIRGFTTISESKDPEELVSLLNEYLSEMTMIVMKNRGLVDKFIGDAVMAFWGAPLKEKAHAELACRTALEMKEKLKELNKRWKKEGMAELEIGIGLNTGDAIVGNMGSEERFDYTAIGDNVNLASRLESLTKEYRAGIIISQSVKDKAEGFEVRELDLVAVKGKNKPIAIYELMGKNPDEKKKMIKKNFEKGLEHYRKKEWKKAVSFFKNISGIDETAKMFIERCRSYEKESPGGNWDGTWKMEKK